MDNNNATVQAFSKDIFKTTKGEYISPVETEEYFMSLEEIDQVCLMGSRFPQPFLVIVLSELGKSQDRETIKTRLQKALAYCNKDRIGYHNIKKVIIAKKEWTIEDNLLTPTLKMKRCAISQLYEASFEKIYLSEDSVSWEQ